MKRIVLAALASLALGNIAAAQEWPNRPIRWIIPFEAGGATDVLGRSVAQEIAKVLPQPVVVENRPGAGGMLAIQNLVDGPADGHAYIYAAVSSFTISPWLFPAQRYDPATWFQGVALVATTALVLEVPANAPAKDLREFVALAKANPGKFNYASGGVGSIPHLVAAMFTSAAGVNITHVPYKGSSSATTDLIRGEINMFMDTPSGTLPMLEAKQIKALAVTTGTRHFSLPDVPTMKEQGVDLEYSTSFGVVTRSETPAAIVNRMNGLINAATKEQALKDRLIKLGYDAGNDSAQQYTAFLQKEYLRWGGVVKSLGITAQQ
jgi:tripartite-type tricarboxylate transporter receptor subunit TctC